MKFCPNSECSFYLAHGYAAEFEDRIEECIDCGTALVDEQPVFDEEPTDEAYDDEPVEELDGELDDDESDPDSEMVILRAQLLPAEAHILRGRLEAEGIPAFVADEHMSSFYLPNSLGGARLLVRERDWELADEILEGTLDDDEELPGVAVEDEDDLLGNAVNDEGEKR